MSEYERRLCDLLTKPDVTPDELWGIVQAVGRFMALRPRS